MSTAPEDATVPPGPPKISGPGNPQPAEVALLGAVGGAKRLRLYRWSLDIRDNRAWLGGWLGHAQGDQVRGRSYTGHVTLPLFGGGHTDSIPVLDWHRHDGSTSAAPWLALELPWEAVWHVPVVPTPAHPAHAVVTLLDDGGHQVHLTLADWHATILDNPQPGQPARLQVGGWVGPLQRVFLPADVTRHVEITLPGRGQIPPVTIMHGTWEVNNNASPDDPFLRFCVDGALADRLRPEPVSGHLDVPRPPTALLTDGFAQHSHTVPVPGRYGEPPCPACVQGRLRLFTVSMAASADPDAVEPEEQITAQVMACRAPGGVSGCGCNILVRPGRRTRVEPE